MFPSVLCFLRFLRFLFFFSFVCVSIFVLCILCYRRGCTLCEINYIYIHMGCCRIKLLLWSSCVVLGDTCIYHCIYIKMLTSVEGLSPLLHHISGTVCLTTSLQSHCRPYATNSSSSDCFLTSLFFSCCDTVVDLEIVGCLDHYRKIRLDDIRSCTHYICVTCEGSRLADQQTSNRCDREISAVGTQLSQPRPSPLCHCTQQIHSTVKVSSSSFFQNPALKVWWPSTSFVHDALDWEQEVN